MLISTTIINHHYEWLLIVRFMCCFLRIAKHRFRFSNFKTNALFILLSFFPLSHCRYY